MVSETTLQKTFDAASAFGRRDHLLSLASLIIFMDILVSLRYGAVLSHVSLVWLQSNVTVGGALIFLLAYAFLRAYVLPFSHGMLLGLILLPSLFISWRQSSQEDRISGSDFLAYSMLTRNTPAYRELERHRDREKLISEASEASFCLVVLIAADLAVSGGGKKTLVRQLLDSLGVLPDALFWICVTLLVVFFLGLIIGAFVAPFLLGDAPFIPSTVLRREIFDSLQRKKRSAWT